MTRAAGPDPADEPNSSGGRLRGRLVVFSGPSGSGKTTVLQQLLSGCSLPLVFSVSATTRPPRPGEREGVNYYYLSRDEFFRRRDAGQFLECFEVFRQGHWYGTLWSEVTSRLDQGLWVVLEIDVQGAQAVLERYPEAVTVFLSPGRLEELERRLRVRNTEAEPDIQRRLAKARDELAAAGIYRFTVVNDDPARAAAEICQILLRVAKDESHVG